VSPNSHSFSYLGDGYSVITKSSFISFDESGDFYCFLPASSSDNLYEEVLEPLYFFNLLLIGGIGS